MRQYDCKKMTVSWNIFFVLCMIGADTSILPLHA